MAKSLMITKILVAAAVALMVAGSPVAEALSCGTVSSKLAACVNYARGNGAPLTDACCNGIKDLNGLANTSQARQEACKCLKDTANSLAGKIDLNLVAGLPTKCGVNVPYKISPSTDCAKVK